MPGILKEKSHITACIGQRNNLAARNPELVAEMKKRLNATRADEHTAARPD